jgi:hypothetical protein
MQANFMAVNPFSNTGAQASDKSMPAVFINLATSFEVPGLTPAATPASTR